jgi:hypothetical protein
MKVFLLTIAGAVLAAVGFELGDDWPNHMGIVIGIFGTVLTVAGAWLQQRTPVRHEYAFAAAQWIPGAHDGYELHVPASKHGRGTGGSAAVYQENGSGHEKVECSVRHTKAGGVVIGASVAFAGKLVIT